MVGLERVERVAEEPGHLLDRRALPRTGRSRPARRGRCCCSMPSRPAMSIAANARYGFAGGVRAAELDPLRLRRVAVHRDADAAPSGCATSTTRFTGASKPGTSRRYEFVVGAQNASSAGACASRPADVVARESARARRSPTCRANSGVPSFQRDWCMCMPEPLSPKIGLGMKVTDLPALARRVLDDVLVDHDLVRHPRQGLEAHVDLALARRSPPRGGGTRTAMPSRSSVSTIRERRSCSVSCGATREVALLLADGVAECPGSPEFQPPSAESTL